MQRSGILFRWTCAAFLVCVALPGCGVKYPYYTLEGAQEARIVEVHINEKQSVKAVMTKADIQDQNIPAVGQRRRDGRTRRCQGDLHAERPVHN